ncbi:FAD-dependent oxidoreductase [Corynebacterium sp. CNJ-954]|uniref:FAD-dependent oxidoreductase n=1 Tax=Corynebacterium sp. CNJ-954 TaxID=1904962 RepID=UPI001C9E459B|nr:FAD-dependent oxidoreductase [Corynebacterium sp. CNJ-954]
MMTTAPTGLQTDVLVIGAGLSGSAAAWKLAELGYDVIVAERDIAASPQGSSHGSARIFRYSYPDPLYTQLTVEAKKGWDDLERRNGRRLITPSGSLDFGSIRNPAVLANILDGTGVEHELLSAHQAGEKWPGLSFDPLCTGSDLVLWQPGAGVINAEATVNAQLAEAKKSGAAVLEHWEAVSVRRSGRRQPGYTVTSTTGETIEAGQVVLAAGGWVADLLAAADLPDAFLRHLPPVEVSQENAYHFPYRDDADCGPVPEGHSTSWPTLINKSPDIQVYSLPGGMDADFRGQKLAEYNAGRKMSSAAAQDGRIDGANRERVIEYVRTMMPGLVPEPYAETTCLFTNLPGEDFLIDRADGITVVSPCSGHGAKFAPLIGDFTAALVAGASRGDVNVPTRFRGVSTALKTAVS